MENKIQSFEDLQIWQYGVHLAVDVYTMLRDTKDWGLKDQMQQAVVSIPSNIAEGFERNSNNELFVL